MMEKKYPRFASVLKNLMEKAKITQKEFAEKIGIAQPNVSRYLNGNIEPTIEKLHQISKLFKISLFDLTGNEAFKGIEKEADELKEAVEDGTFKLSEDEQELLEAWQTLPDDDWRKKAINDMLRKK